MQEKQLFEYAVIRIVPMVEREEFMNVGVVLYCAGQKFLKAIYTLDEQRLQGFSATLDINEVKEYLDAFCRICAANEDAGPVAKLIPAERFRWLTATRSTVVQTSKVHPGLCDDAATMLEHLYSQLVATSAE